MRRWLRQVWPAEGWLVFFFGLHLALFALIRHAFSSIPAVSNNEVSDLLRMTPQPFLIVGAILYGIYRVRHFHPVWRNDYRMWLRLTPWRPGSPLPFGPIQLAPQDVVLFGLVLA